MIHSRDEETIIAQCTPRGSGALTLLRLSGDNALEVASQIARLPKSQSLITVASHTIHFGHVIDDTNTPVDQVMFSVMHAPRTFTGQNVVELTCHNNPFIVERIIALCILKGARLAREGEFSSRAFMNGKIDLLQAEAINELIHAQTQDALKKSLSQLEGSFSHWLSAIEQKLIRTLAWCEASFEFLDDESEFGVEIAQELARILDELTNAKKIYDLRKQIRQGIRIALIGSVNAGKSSLFNVLVGEQRAIVTKVAGTTRDSIEAGLYRDGHYWTLIDTAGIRQTDDIIEQEGIRRSHDEAKKADIILLIYDGSRPLLQHEEEAYHNLRSFYSSKIILVQNKIDLPQKMSLPANWPQEDILKVSGSTGTCITTLEHAIQKKVKSLFAAHDTPFLLNERQFNHILGLEQLLLTVLAMLSQQTIAYELISFQLREGLEVITQLTGRSISEAALDKVFKEFCVGK
jgi:tRNA modification GTPase